MISDESEYRLALVSAPWPLYSRPSIQLGALKAYVKAEIPDVRIDTYHLYLDAAAAIGYVRYHTISERTWPAESVCAALLYPERFAEIENFFYRQIRGNFEAKNIDFEGLVEKLDTTIQQFVGSVDWQIYGLVGFTICFCQLTATLYTIRLIKKHIPRVPIVVGGSMFAGRTARELLEVFPEIQFAVSGEGEKPLVSLIRQLRQSGTTQIGPEIQGIIHAGRELEERSNRVCQLEKLTSLPTPDYDDYFKQLRALPPAKRFFPTLMAEISRGCWWNRPAGLGQTGGCAFCNLNLQWQGYRSKSPGQVSAEIDHLTTRYRSLHVAFADNLIPAKSTTPIFERLDQLNKDLHLFCEIRANISRSALEVMRRAGVVELQVGIEALSNNLLKKINKGTTVIQNLEVMKHCEELGLQNCSNLIMQFPGSDEQDVQETLDTLTFASYFRPMQAVNFWLGLESPVWQTPAKYGILSRFNHPHWSKLFPSAVSRNLTFIIQSYRGDMARQRRIWKPVRLRIKRWQAEYQQLRSTPDSPPILSYRDGRDFLIIRQRRFGAPPQNHRLTGTSRQIYLYCSRSRSLASITNKFPDFKESAIKAFLAGMVEKRLVYGEKDRYLSLAVRVGNLKLEIGK